MKKGLFFLVALCAYLLYTPVPEGITEPLRYRTLVAGTKLIDLVARCKDLIWPNAPNDMTTFRHAMDMTVIGLSDTKTGSNFKARVTYFDGVKVRLYEPIEKSSSLLPGFIYYHGGGFCIGSTEFYDGVTRQIADDLNAVVISVDYRLSPEHPFPAPFEDCLKASEWFISHAEEFGVDASRIGIGGDSAGGYLTSLVTQFLVMKNVQTKVQMLIYPATPLLDTATPGFQKYQHEFGNGGTLSLPFIARFYLYHILGSKNPEFEELFIQNNHLSPSMKETEFVKKYINHSLIPENMRSPSFYKGPTDPKTGSEAMWKEIEKVCLDSRFNAFQNLPMKGLPPAYIVTCGFDSIRDEGILYGEALKASGVGVTWKHYESAFHGIFWMEPIVSFDLGAKMRREALDFVKTLL
ncbi:putative arylacetamide deacetylase [Apostichopus japonicus]|uniref:Putative arylacetamide deacetylase n=1 Tax=Stichopus japonicus TaxID=307972 RepID=A0A2G8KU16_STIJA|nr:putative arylacetamide deacetylase [Apostichopus japonicus]